MVAKITKVDECGNALSDHWARGIAQYFVCARARVCAQICVSVTPTSMAFIYTAYHLLSCVCKTYTLQ